MRTKFLLALCVVAVAVAVACGRSDSPVAPSSIANGDSGAAADGSTLKIAAPALVTPDGIQPEPGAGVVLTLNNVQGKYATFPVTFEFEITDTADNVVIRPNPMVPAGAGGTTSYTIAVTLPQNTRFNWRARATYDGAFGPWSAKRSFVAPIGAFLDATNDRIFDPLVSGTTVGTQHGGHFIIGQGWQADTLSDGIDYDIKTCSSCRAEFDLTGVGNGLGNPTDLKPFTMADAPSFGDFNAFRDGPWKMTLEQRADGDGTGMKLIWRNGDAGDGDPGDHTGKLNSTDVPWKDNVVNHFVFDWTPDGFAVSVNGIVYFEDGFSGAYAPPHHRIELGCIPRAETLRGAIFRNFRLTPH